MRLSYLVRGFPGHPLHPPLTDATIGAYTTATVLGISVVIVMVGWRIYRGVASAPPTQLDVVATLPKGAKVVSTATAGERVIVTVDVSGAVEIRTYDAATLQPVGRLRFVEER